MRFVQAKGDVRQLPTTGHVGHFALAGVSGSYDPMFFRIWMSAGQLVGDLVLSKPAQSATISVPKVSEELLTHWHESMHWFQDVGTAYGLFWQMLTGAPTKLINTYCVAHERHFHGDSVLFPAMKYCPDLTEFRYFCDTAAAHLTLRGLLEGEVNTTTVEACHVQLLSSHDYVDREFCVGYWKRLTKLEEGNRVPAVPLASDGLPLGAVALIEGHAHAIEELAIYLAPRKSTGLRMFDPRTYYGVYKRAFEDMRISFGRPPLAQQTPEETARDLYRFLVICDLALSTPIHPLFRLLWKETYKWGDFHPGWRFGTICKLLAENYKVVALLDDLSVRGYEQFTSVVCKELAWPSPTQLASYVIPEEGDLITTLAKRASSLRIKNPALFVDPFLQRGGDTVRRDTLLDLYESLPPPRIDLEHETDVFPARIQPPIDWLEHSLTSTQELATALEFIGAIRATAEHLMFRHGAPSIELKLADSTKLVEWVTGLPYARAKFV